MKPALKSLLQACRQRLPHLNFRQKITASILTFAILPLLVFGVYYLIQLWYNLTNELDKTYTNQMDTYVYDMEIKLAGKFQELRFINSNPQIISYITSDHSENLLNTITSAENIRSIFDALESSNSQTSFLYLYNDSIFETNNILHVQALDSKLREELVSEPLNSIVFKKRHLQDSYTNVWKDYICLYQLLTTMNHTPLAIVEIRMPMTDFSTSNLPDNSFMILTDGGQMTEVVGSNGVTPEQALQVHAGGSKNFHLTNAKKIKDTPFTAMLYVSDSNVFAVIYSFLFWALLVLLAIITVVVFTIKFTSVRLTGRLTALLDDINTNIESYIDTGNSTPPAENPLPRWEDEEFDTIHRKFREMAQKIDEYHRKSQEYDKQNAQYQLEIKTLQLKVLQERINPHFLYNTLSAIKWAYSNEHLAAVIDSMVKYYRIALSKGKEIISMQQEMDMIHEYLQLQKFDYDTNFTHTIEMDQAAAATPIPKQLLQPIVENAFLHGVRTMGEAGHIAITAKKDGDNIQIAVQDNGHGMTQDKAERLIRGEKTNAFGGYGIRNVLERLQIIYNGNFSLRIDSQIDKGTCVLLTLPVQNWTTPEGTDI